MTHSSMFDTLLSLPIFQGLGYEDLTRILESTRLEFLTTGEAETFAKADQHCEHLFFVFKGIVKKTTFSADRSWYIEEDLHTPLLIGLDVLFSPSMTIRSSFTALTSVSYFKMEKRAFRALASYYEVVRINIINTLTIKLQRQEQEKWLPAPSSLEEQVIYFMRTHVTYPAGHKCFHISMRNLGNYLGKDQRIIAKVLHTFEIQGLLQCANRSYNIPSFEKLLQYKAS